MLRVFSLVAVIAVSHATFCEFAIADSDSSFVRVAVDEDFSSVAVSGRTRVDVIAAVLCGLEKCNVPADGVTTGPWLRLPEDTLSDKDKRPHLTVCVSDRIEGGAKTAYICITPKFPFTTVAAVAAELQASGFTDVRLLSDDTFRTEILELSGRQAPATSAVVTLEATASK